MSPDRDRPLIVVSNRGPAQFDLDENDQRTLRRGGGLVTALTGLVSHRDALWIASAMTDEDIAVSEEEGGPVELSIDGIAYRVLLVESDAEAYDRFYNIIANPILWFIQHYLWDLSNAPDIRQEELDAWDYGYQAVNSDIARAVLGQIEGRERPKYRVTGRPIPARNRATSRAEGRRVFDLPPRARVLLVFGGSQGARSLNDEVVEAFRDAGPAVLHLCGERDFELLRGRVRRDDYRLVPFTNDFGAAVGAADLVVARAGGSVWEVAAAGKPAILVPYPFATADHQAKNARFFERAGGAITVPETELGRVADLARSLIGDPERLKEMGDAMKRVAKPDAAEEIAEGLIQLAT